MHNIVCINFVKNCPDSQHSVIWFGLITMPTGNNKRSIYQVPYRCLYTGSACLEVHTLSQDFCIMRI